ncbi:hypothetical protein AX16_000392 [Volvariella volvacea WC 439]|nr:hypothetical protein AX16_000392 [Volvariella volvacea WC 439]
MQEYDMLICTTHYLGDGIALHTFAHDFFHLLGDRSQGDLVDILQSEWTTRCSDPDVENVIPAPLEDRLPNLPHNSIQRAAARIDFQLTQERLIGGHSFPKRGGQPRHTIVPTISIDESRTQKILKKCKEKGVSISSALFAICNIAWGRTSRQNWELPMMMYSALNLRPNLVFHKSHHDSYWFIAIGYFNVVLPTFLPKDSDRGNVESMFWLRAHSAKKQSTVAAKSKLLSGRCREMARERAERARIWAKEDDEKAAGTRKAPDSVPAKPKAPARPPSNALIGLSLLGNLDAIYKHASFPEIQLHTLTTGSRQRPGGMLLFSYTFVGKLWVSLGYDENGFEKGVVDTYWHNILSGIEEFLG